MQTKRGDLTRSRGQHRRLRLSSKARDLHWRRKAMRASRSRSPWRSRRAHGIGRKPKVAGSRDMNVQQPPGHRVRYRARIFTNLERSLMARHVFRKARLDDVDYG